MEQHTFTVLNEEGQEITCDILFTFDLEETGRSCIVYTDNTRDEKGDIQVFASIYDPARKNPRLEPIETEQEWNAIETILTNLQDQIRDSVMGAE